MSGSRSGLDGGEPPAIRAAGATAQAAAPAEKSCLRASGVLFFLGLGHRFDLLAGLADIDTALEECAIFNADALRNDVINARSGLSGAQVGGVVLSLGAAVAVALGLWPRLK